MVSQIRTVKCTSVLAQVNVGFFDQDGNMVAEAAFPQAEGRAGGARLFNPHQEQLGAFIDLCIQQAWEQLKAGGPEGESERHKEHAENNRIELALGT